MIMSLDCPMGHLWCSASHELRRASRAGASQGSWFLSFTGVDEGVALEQHRDLGFFPSHELRRASHTRLRRDVTEHLSRLRWLLSVPSSVQFVWMDRIDREPCGPLRCSSPFGWRFRVRHQPQPIVSQVLQFQ
jgi:hypothetical protein